MLLLQFVLYLPSFVGTLKNEIAGAAPELWQLKIEQFSPGILKFGTKHKDNPLTLNFSKVSHTFLFIFHAGWCALGSKNFQNSSYREKMTSSAHVSRLSFHFYEYGFYYCCFHIKIRTKRKGKVNLETRYNIPYSVTLYKINEHFSFSSNN